jgi:hypothetical protein
MQEMLQTNISSNQAKLVSAPDQNKPKHHRQKKNQNKHILYLKCIEPPKMGVWDTARESLPVWLRPSIVSLQPRPSDAAPAMITHQVIAAAAGAQLRKPPGSLPVHCRQPCMRSHQPLSHALGCSGVFLACPFRV